MRVKNILLDNNIKSINKTTIIKLCLSKFIIISYLENFSNMKNYRTNDFEECYKSYCKNPSNTDFSEMYYKKGVIYNNLFRTTSFCSITNWHSEFLNDIGVNGPYISDRQIYFYNLRNNLLAAFSYFPFHNLVNQEGALSDLLVREINFYVFDNVSIENFYRIFSDKTEEEIDYKAIECHRSLSTRYSNVTNDIVRIIKYNNNYHWQFITLPDKSSISEN